jgi:nitroimidazol reductase NimA-like FMN-containing flavoprotein (pyridoxamine 5'-phosphate oxidase superfamily)
MPRAFTDAERQEFLAALHVGVLSVAAGDRPPASVPIWYDYAPGGNIRINTGASRRKAKLIEAAGAVTLVFQREELPYQYVVVEGTVVDVTKPGPDAGSAPSTPLRSTPTSSGGGASSRPPMIARPR